MNLTVILETTTSTKEEREENATRTCSESTSTSVIIPIVPLHTLCCIWELLRYMTLAPICILTLLGRFVLSLNRWSLPSTLITSPFILSTASDIMNLSFTTSKELHIIQFTCAAFFLNLTICVVHSLLSTKPSSIKLSWSLCCKRFQVRSSILPDLIFFNIL